MLGQIYLHGNEEYTPPQWKERVRADRRQANGMLKKDPLNTSVERFHINKRIHLYIFYFNARNWKRICVVSTLQIQSTKDSYLTNEARQGNHMERNQNFMKIMVLFKG